MPVIGRGAEVGDYALNVADFLQKFVVDAAVKSSSIVQGERSVQCEALEINDWINVDGAVFGVLKNLLDGDVALQVENRHVGLHSWTVESSGSCLATVLAGLIPWRGADGEALRGGNNCVEGVEGWTGDESGLVGDPEVADGVKSVGEYDSLLLLASFFRYIYLMPAIGAMC